MVTWLEIPERQSAGIWWHLQPPCILCILDQSIYAIGSNAIHIHNIYIYVLQKLDFDDWNGCLLEQIHVKSLLNGTLISSSNQQPHSRWSRTHTCASQIPHCFELYQFYMILSHFDHLLSKFFDHSSQFTPSSCWEPTWQRAHGTMAPGSPWLSGMRRPEGPGGGQHEVEKWREPMALMAPWNGDLGHQEKVVL